VLEPPFFAFIPLSAFDLPLALGGHYTPSLLPPSLLPPVTSDPFTHLLSHTSAEPLDKTDPYLLCYPLFSFNLLHPLYSSIPTNPATGSVVYTREDDRPFTKLRPIYEPTPSQVKSVPSARG